jgi:hypothetical protein
MAVKYIDIKEFREQGFLQEANRLFFHPLGLALEVRIDEQGNETLGGIWDYRDDPEGIIYTMNSIQRDKIDTVNRERGRHSDRRIEIFGSEIQAPD